MARGRPRGSRNRKVLNPAEEAFMRVGPQIEAQAAEAGIQAEAEAEPAEVVPQAEEPPEDYVESPLESVVAGFDPAAKARILSCNEVYLVCKNSAQDKSVHRAEWLKWVV